MEEDGRGSALPFLLVWRARLFTRRELYQSGHVPAEREKQ
jgi:hypothetical protein